MSKPRPNYRHKLARPLTLRDGTKLVTLRDAANVLLYVFGSADTQIRRTRPRSRRLLDGGRKRQARRHQSRDRSDRTHAAGAAALGKRLLIRERSNAEHPSRGSLWFETVPLHSDTYHRWLGACCQRLRWDLGMRGSS